MATEFLNVDLDLESGKSLEPLLSEWGDQVHVLYHGPSDENTNLLALEVYEGDDEDPDSIINAFCGLIESLSPRGRAVWNNCSMRRFDIGFESGVTGRPLYVDLDSKTLKRVSDLSGSIGVTIYPKKMGDKKKKPE
jgi:hypothetical protein